MNAVLVLKTQRTLTDLMFVLLLALSSHGVTRSLYRHASTETREVTYFSITSAFRVGHVCMSVYMHVAKGQLVESARHSTFGLQGLNLSLQA